MPTKKDHETLARENLKALEFLRTRIDDFPQWATCIAFYAGVQIVEAVFAHSGEHSDDHKSRNRMLKNDRPYQNIWKHYRPLWSDSLVARYMEDVSGSHRGPLFSVYMPGHKVDEMHIRHHLLQIMRSARKLMNDETFLSGCDPRKL